MKKLLLVAILMLALVVTAVACTQEKTPADTDAVTTAGENATQAPADDETKAPADETKAPADETNAPADETKAPADETNAPVDETKAPDDETKAPETTEEETTVDPADPVLMIDAEAIKGLSGAGAPNVNQVGSCEVMTEGGYTFARLTATGEDPYLAVIPLGSDYTLPQYMAVSYRTNSATDGQFFMGSGAGWTGKGDVFNVAWNEGDWNFQIIDLAATGVTTITDGKLAYARLDFFAGNSAEGDYFDVEYVAFFNSAEYAEAYDFAKHPPYVEKEAAGMIAHSFDTFYVNGAMYFEADGGAGDKLTAINNTVAFGEGAAHDSMMLRGWIGFGQPFVSFGYFIDNYTMVYGDFATATEDGVKKAGGENASRFEIPVPLTDLEPGVHTVGFVVKLEDGTVVRLRENIKVIIVPTHTDKTVTLGIRNCDTPFTSGAEKKFGQRFQLTEGFLKGITIDALATYDDGNVNKWSFKVWQWKGDYATTVAATPLYATTGENHNNCAAFTVAIPATAYVTGDIFYELEYVEGSKGFTGWGAGDLLAGIESYVEGMLKDGGYSASMSVGVKFEGEYVEGDATNVFASDINSNTAGADLKASDLGSYFAAAWGANEPHNVVDQDGTLLYAIGGFNALSVNPNGKYAFTVKDLVTEGAGFSGIFVRAIRAASPEKQFYGADGNDADATGYGGSGIYIAMEDADTLRINIKSYVDGKYVINVYTVDVASNNITVIDDGATVYIVAGDALAATIAINGTADYGIDGVAADVASASATLTIGGETYEIANAILAAACDVENSIGMATRGHGKMTFSAVSVAGFSTVEIPGAEAPETPVDPETPEEPAEPEIPTYTAWNADKTIVTHQSFDELYYGEGRTGVFAPGQSGGWNKVATLDASIDVINYWGWIGIKGELGQFGYQIDANEVIFDDAFTHATEEGVINAAKPTGADTASRMLIGINVADLTGEHIVNVLYKNAAGDIVALCTFKVVK